MLDIIGGTEVLEVLVVGSTDDVDEDVAEVPALEEDDEEDGAEPPPTGTPALAGAT